MNDYERRLKEQIDQYRHVTDIHELPAIYHYWSNRYLRPRLESVLGVSSPNEFYAHHFFERAQDNHENPRFWSIGSGDCSVEIDLAKTLRSMGLESFTIDCVEVSPVLLARGREAARAAGIESCLRFVEADLNSWTSDSNFVGVMAHHTLHHLVELESLFENVRRLLLPDGVFVTAGDDRDFFNNSVFGNCTRKEHFVSRSFFDLVGNHALSVFSKKFFFYGR